MFALPRALLVAALAAFAALPVSPSMADGPKDNLTDNVRPIPPKGNEIPAADREAIKKGLAELQQLIKAAGAHDLLPDVQIYEKAAKVHPGQLWLKRAILEMGGKDAIIVDETADLEAAAQGIVASAFGFQGQKCSAASRAIIVDGVYENVAERIVTLAQQLTVGAPDTSHEFDMGPVIEEDAFNRIKRYAQQGLNDGELLTGGAPESAENGYFVQPTVFGEVSPDAPMAQEEIFGPVLALLRASDYQNALDIANGTLYGLTGAVFSSDRRRLEQARREFHVGNLYLNRKSTGAYVGVHPFGGFNMSGTDSKAGGPDYLLLFTQAKSVAERL